MGDLRLAFREPARSYACEGVGQVRETRVAGRLTPAATVQGPDARSKGLEALHGPTHPFTPPRRGTHNRRIQRSSPPRGAGGWFMI